MNVSYLIFVIASLGSCLGGYIGARMAATQLNTRILIKDADISDMLPAVFHGYPLGL